MSTKPKTLHEKLLAIHAELKAPKNQYNNFGRYSYRKLEDILDAVKPLLLREGITLTLTDTVLEAGPVVYVDSVASVQMGDVSISVAAQAGIEKAGGMQLAQAFGAASSYARKYALNGLFLIDDSKDPDEEKPEPQPEKKSTPPPAPKVVWVEPSANTQRETLIADGWDGITIYNGEPAGKKYPYVMTRSGNIMLSGKQAKAFAMKAKERAKEKEMMRMAIESGATESDLY